MWYKAFFDSSRAAAERCATCALTPASPDLIATESSDDQEEEPLVVQLLSSALGGKSHRATKLCQCVLCAKHFCTRHCDLAHVPRGLLPDGSGQHYACHECEPQIRLLEERDLVRCRLWRLSKAEEQRHWKASLCSGNARSVSAELSRECIECGGSACSNCELCGLALCNLHLESVPLSAGAHAAQPRTVCGRCADMAMAQAAARTAVREVMASIFRRSLTTLHLPNVIAPAEVADDCASCGLMFADADLLHTVQYHCCACGRLLCAACLHGKEGLGAMSLGPICRAPHPVQDTGRSEPVCSECAPIVQARSSARTVLESVGHAAVRNGAHVSRIIEFVRDPQSAPLHQQSHEDTTSDKAVRASDFALRGAGWLTNYVPMARPLTFTIQALQLLWDYGQLGILGYLVGHEFAKALKELKCIVRRLPSIQTCELLVGALYLSADQRKCLRDQPSSAHQEALSHGHAPPANLLHQLLELAPLCMCSYQQSPFEVQRIALQQRWHLVTTGGLAESSSWRRPAWCLLVRPTEKIAVLAIRGTSVEQSHGGDILACAHALPTAVTGAGGLRMVAHRGMLATAQVLESEVRHTLRVLVQEGYSLHITGHSLGAGLAALLVWLLRYGSDGTALPASAKLHGAGFATPCVVDRGTASTLEPHFTSVVNSMDIVPRLTAKTVAKLSSEIRACARESRNDLEQDVEDYMTRLLRLWEPRVREGVQPLVTVKGREMTQMTLQSLSSVALPAGYAPLDEQEAKGLELIIEEARTIFTTLDRDGSNSVSKIELIVGLKSSHLVREFFGLPGQIRQEDAATRRRLEDIFQSIDKDNNKSLTWDELELWINDNPSRWHCREKVRKEAVEDKVVSPHRKELLSHVTEHMASSKMSIRMGKGEEQSSLEAHLDRAISFTDSRPGPKSTAVVFELEDADLKGAADLPAQAKPTSSACKEVTNGDASQPLEASAEVLPTEELFVPGKVMWIHRVDGHLDAAMVPCDLPSLRRIIMDKRMIEDHAMEQIRNALHCVRKRRSEDAREVKWQPFCQAGECCPCCGSRYEWSSTARSRKQRWLAMTNCRACGLVVCSSCAETRRTLPHQGILEPARVCDRCAWRLPEGSSAGSGGASALGCVNDAFGALT